MIKQRTAYHPKESFISEVDVLINGGENTEDETDEHSHETAQTNNTLSHNIPIAVPRV